MTRWTATSRWSSRRRLRTTPQQIPTGLESYRPGTHLRGLEQGQVSGAAIALVHRLQPQIGLDSLFRRHQRLQGGRERAERLSGRKRLHLVGGLYPSRGRSSRKRLVACIVAPGSGARGRPTAVE
jgi:hypothetical protein